MRISVARRLERLEHQTKLCDVHHLVNVTYVDENGRPSGGYRIEGPFTNGEWSRTPLELSE